MPSNIHISESCIRLGGVESLIRQILLSDPLSSAAGILDLDSGGADRAMGLRKHRFSSAVSIRRAAKSYRLSAETVIWHNFAGLMMCGAVIPCDQSILFLHTNSTDVFDLLPERIPYLHGILTSGDDLKKEIHARIPKVPLPVIPLEYPLPSAVMRGPSRVAGSSIMIGYSGRLEITQKKVLRLEEFCRALNAAGIHFNLEILGAGSAEQALRKILKPWNPSFLGQCSSGEVMKIYGKWDYSVCCSDYETGPLSILEGMVAGALPVYPEIPSQAAKVLHELDYPRYTPGDMKAAADLILKLEQEGKGEQMRTALSRALEHRTPMKFVEDMNQALAVIAWERRQVMIPPLPYGFKEYLPFVLRSRLPEKGGFLK